MDLGWMALGISMECHGSRMDLHRSGVHREVSLEFSLKIHLNFSGSGVHIHGSWVDLRMSLEFMGLGWILTDLGWILEFHRNSLGNLLSWGKPPWLWGGSRNFIEFHGSGLDLGISLEFPGSGVHLHGSGVGRG